MSSNSAGELFSFHEFVAVQLQSSGELRTPEDCLEMWRAMHPQSDEFDLSVKATQQALSDMRAGDSGRSARDLLSQARQKYNAGS